MIEGLIGVAIGADAAISVNAGRLRGGNQPADGPEQATPEPEPGEVTLDRDAVRLFRGILYAITFFVCSTMLLLGVLIGL